MRIIIESLKRKDVVTIGKNPAFQFYPGDWARDLEEHPLEIGAMEQSAPSKSPKNLEHFIIFAVRKHCDGSTECPSKKGGI